MFDVKKMGEQIARLRKGNKYTQEQLAGKLKISPQAISKWENGNAVPEVSMLYEISKLFNCSIDRLLDPSSCVLCKEKRNQIIEMLRRSSEQEELASSYLQKATENIQK